MEDGLKLLGFNQTPPKSPWGINFGGGENSTAIIVECRKRGLSPDWILFADTGSEKPGSLEHVHRVRDWAKGWADIDIVRWERVRGEVMGFEPLHDNCLRTGHLPSKAYGLAGCTSKWKIQPMERWRKERGFNVGSFAVGYDAGEYGRIKKACDRGDDPEMTAWYPLVAWGINRMGCEIINALEGLSAGKSSCWMCPNMRRHEWLELRQKNPDLFAQAVEIEKNAFANGNYGRGGGGLYKGTLQKLDSELAERGENDVLEDRCHHGGCFT